MININDPTKRPALTEDQKRVLDSFIQFAFEIVQNEDEESHQPGTCK